MLERFEECREDNNRALSPARLTELWWFKSEFAVDQTRSRIVISLRSILLPSRSLAKRTCVSRLRIEFALSRTVSREKKRKPDYYVSSVHKSLTEIRACRPGVRQLFPESSIAAIGLQTSRSSFRSLGRAAEIQSVAIIVAETLQRAGIALDSPDVRSLALICTI